MSTAGVVTFPTGYGAGPVISSAAGVLSVAATVAAPGTTVGVAIVNFYGSSATNFLGTPNAWQAINIGGTDYKVPLYT